MKCAICGKEINGGFPVEKECLDRIKITKEELKNYREVLKKRKPTFAAGLRKAHKKTSSGTKRIRLQQEEL